MRFLLLAIACLFACAGSSSGGSTTPIGNATTAKPTRDGLVKDVAAAVSAGDATRLIALADPRGLLTRALDCPIDGARAFEVLEPKLKGRATELVRSAKGAQITVLELENELRSWNSRKRRGNASLITKGGSVEGCTAKTDLLFHEVHAKIRVESGGASRDVPWKLDLVLVDGQWYLADIPKGVGGGTHEALERFSEFTDRMCACKDKACSEKVNEDMVKWGQEMAKNADDKADDLDPDTAKKFADVSTKYSECMMKLMTPPTP